MIYNADSCNTGTYSIQSFSREYSQFVLSFANNTNAQGAFIVCRSSDPNRNELNYKVAGLERLQNSIQFEVQSEETYQSNCSTLVYDLDRNGLLKEKQILRPSFQVENQSCITGCESSTSSTYNS